MEKKYPILDCDPKPYQLFLCDEYADTFVEEGRRYGVLRNDNVYLFCSNEKQISLKKQNELIRGYNKKKEGSLHMICIDAFYIQINKEALSFTSQMSQFVKKNQIYTVNHFGAAFIEEPFVGSESIEGHEEEYFLYWDLYKDFYLVLFDEKTNARKEIHINVNKFKENHIIEIPFTNPSTNIKEKLHLRSIVIEERTSSALLTQVSDYANHVLPLNKK